MLVASPPPGAPRAALPPVLAVHGFASSAAGNWQRTGHLDALTAAGRTVIAPDLRGHGESDRPHRTDAYTLPAVLGDLVAAVQAVTGPADGAGSGEVGRPTVTGPADGAPWSRLAPPAAAGLDHESRHGTSSGATPPAGERDLAAVDLLGYSLGARLCWILAARGVLPARRMVLGGFDGRALFEGVDPARLDALAASAPGSDPEALRHLVAGLRSAGDEETGGAPSDMPILLAAGDRDPIAARAGAFAEGLENAEFLPIPGRNHITAVPTAAFRRAVVDFLAGRRPAD